MFKTPRMHRAYLLYQFIFNSLDIHYDISSRAEMKEVGMKEEVYFTYTQFVL